MTNPLVHRRARMGGRDPHEAGRVASPLELLFDLTFVVAFGLVADELAHYLAEDHVKTALLGFALGGFSITWAWINFSWFASAFDVDDWVYRLTTMLQMTGVVILALGLADLFESIDEGSHVDNVVMVAGYVVMRVAMLFQWSRAARHAPEYRAACMTYIRWVALAQVGWIALAIAHTSILVTFVFVGLLTLVEFAGPYLAETRKGGTPWHAHHIAERYGLLIIIALGEGIIGTIATLSAIVGPEGPGWSVSAAVVALSGVGLTFGLWWAYFVVPFGDFLHARRERSFVWGYGNVPIIAAVVAMGGGLHVAAYYIEHHSELDAAGTILTVAIPVAVVVLGIYAQYSFLTRSIDRFHGLLIGGSAALLVLSFVLANAGLALHWCLLVVALVPWVTVVGYELRGHQHNERMLQSLQ
ncbi:low temperature requirement protein A [Solirubrobacter phytolaccae]|uniref:Low temperature requirement protein A n=2 Tax=Solirubrobacter phytolaccae TaxID=1404360 RepID=A0A9X3NFN0_9ACTN|nr:low temperature requirement protein A [Solirubrobacter phytolaccae]MDA0185206.1 low temperature requirement protein A [Solirubrobacter phytolaccae]